ncbi:DUF6090 family protein, partial [Robiginitalea marina]
LLAENKINRYLLYAFGEIVLVVIGILIALQVNNWNEERKKQQEISKLLHDIEQDLLLNYELAGFALDFYKVQDSIARRIAHKTLSKADYQNNSRLSYYISNWEYYLPVEKNIDQFVESEKLVPPEYKPVVDALKRLQNLSAVLDDTWANLKGNIDENTQRLTSFNWFVKNDSVSTELRINYFLNDEGYETLALRYWVQTQNYYDKISRYRAQAIGALATIKATRDRYSARQIHGLFQKSGMPAFKRYPCSVVRSELPSLKTIRASELYGNLTPDTLHIELTNNRGQAISEFTLAPSTFMSIPGSEYFGLDGDKNTLARVTDPAGNCVGIYGAFENGYLLIPESNTP